MPICDYIRKLLRFTTKHPKLMESAFAEGAVVWELEDKGTWQLVKGWKTRPVCSERSQKKEASERVGGSEGVDTTKEELEEDCKKNSKKESH